MSSRIGTRSDPMVALPRTTPSWDIVRYAFSYGGTHSRDSIFTATRDQVSAKASQKPPLFGTEPCVICPTPINDSIPMHNGMLEWGEHCDLRFLSAD